MTQQLTGDHSKGSTLLVGMKAGPLDTGLLDIGGADTYPFFFTTAAGNRYEILLGWSLDGFYYDAIFTVSSA